MRSVCFILFGLSALWFPSLQAQDTATLNVEQLLGLVKTYHPVVKQAYLNTQIAKNEITIARGAFNPLINYYLGNKKLGNELYYDVNSAKVTLPTWYGIEVSAGIDNNFGDRLDPSVTSGETGFAGLSVPLAKNLVTDKRRTALRQAKLFREMALTEQRALINDLLMDAAEAYWHWVRSYQHLQLLNNGVKTNETRLELVKKSVVNGERPSIDTVETTSQLQNFKYQRSVYEVEYKNAMLALSAFLWKEDATPYLLPEFVTPFQSNDTAFYQLGNQLSLADLTERAKQHPNLAYYELKLNSLNLEKRLKFQELLPKVDVGYYTLSKSGKWASTNSEFSGNQQYGLKVEMPLFFSQGRGSYNQAKLKIQQTTLEQTYKSQLIAIKVKQYFNELAALRQQIEIQEANYQNYLTLQRAEESRFFHGESSLFLINSREIKSMEAFEKLITLKTKYFKTIYALQWSAGLLQQ
jgi:outer membrane protein TolC